MDNKLDLTTERIEQIALRPTMGSKRDSDDDSNDDDDDDD